MKHANVSNVATDFGTLSKQELRALADKLLDQDPGVIDYCVEFVMAETKGLWHGRARAMMCRRLKHCQLGAEQQERLSECILDRLSSGNFSEQFKDQLRLALQIDERHTLTACQLASSSNTSHIRRYSQWALSIQHARSEA
jgi:hypothetical protein